LPILIGNGVDNVDVTSPTSGVTFGATTNFTSDGIVEINYPANPNSEIERYTEAGDQRIIEGSTDYRIAEQGEMQVIQINLESTYINGDVTTENLFLIQEA